MFANLRNRLTRTQWIAVGFLLIILCGTCLLMLPISSRMPGGTDFLSALFTAASATCVTGLVVVDTYQHWTLFGQTVILLMIQVGGLGFVTFGVTILLMMGKRIGLADRGLLRDSVNTLELGGIVRLAKLIVKGTLLIEGTGAVLLSIRFVPEFGLAEGIYYGIFHSVSAFCNAGFDLMGRFEAYSSLVRYADDWLVNLTTVSLVLIGGLGFVVWRDLYKNRLHMKKYTLHTKMVLTALVVLVVFPMPLFWLLERGGVLAGLDGSGQFLGSLFAVVTPRTAGFNTTDVAGMGDAGKLLTLVLMLIGGNPGSTAGGVKTTTIMVLLFYVVSMIQHRDGVNIYGRRLEDGMIEKAAIVFTLTLTMAVTASFLICAIDGLPLTDVLLETFSAVDTVGMSTGITRKTGACSRVILILLMYCGRIGSLSFALAFTDKKRRSSLRQPMERINIG
ncbi:MAG: Trk family potassium uptake protein [Lachnospiraceae bacterium]|nr:Trk family potassium uptake protein [Lachnospiraceae bacterium]MCI9657694.1 Trk family potassium uptake protein [Lachnospiraceae bacterium]